MEYNSAVEWELVDYGSGIFHVVSYQNGGAEETAVVLEAADAASVKQDAPQRECVFYRCWVAMKDGGRPS